MNFSTCDIWNQSIALRYPIDKIKKIGNLYFFDDNNILKCQHFFDFTVTNDDVKKAKEYFTTALDDMLESPLEIIDCYYMMEVLGSDDFKTKREKMLMVTKEEILAVANKVSLHTVFCLKGVNNEEN